MSIISDRGALFTTDFLKTFQKGLGKQVKLSTRFHPYTDGKTERTNQTLEYIIIACVIYIKEIWDHHLPLIEFSYNKSYHSSISMAFFEALCGRKCRSLVGLFKVVDSSIFGQ